MRKLSLLALIGLAALSTNCVVDEDLSTTSAHAIGPATIASSAASYNYASNITINWSGMPTNANDWIAIAPAGSALTSVTKWVYTGGSATGSTVFSGPSTGGSYVARGFLMDSYTLQGESDPFNVQDPGSTMAVLMPTQPTYAIDDPISIVWSGLPGNAEDWIAIAPAGFPLNDQADWQYTGGGTSGTMVFPDGLAPTGFPGGSYVARAYLNNTFTLVGESAAFIIGGLVTTDQSTYELQENITVTWTNLPGDPQDWIALAPAGSPNTTVTRWVFTGGGVSGNVTFSGGLATSGSYVARAFLSDTYNLAGESAPFTVQMLNAITVTTNASTYTAGQVITVSWTGLPPNATDWISIAPVGASESVTTRWRYTGGLAAGSLAFEGVAAGTYEARAYISDSYTRVGTSVSFAVTP